LYTSPTVDRSATHNCNFSVLINSLMVRGMSTLCPINFSTRKKLESDQYSKLSDTLTGHTNIVISLAFSPDGKKLASGSIDNTIKLWDVKTHKNIKTVYFKKDEGNPGSGATVIGAMGWQHKTVDY
ncbi:MAG: hypothetical protein HQL03_12920, partial [Nitrospirae bacterium]|nr:hypothetical protein [Nitrospirota bacterium]